MKEPVLVGWSGGKDSALALHEALKKSRYDITLLTTITEDYKRISMHGVREQLLQAQADSLNFPIVKVYIPKECSHEEYDRLMEDALKSYLASGYRSMIFGDIFLQGIREYREKNLAKADMKALFPIWGKSTEQLSKNFIRNNFKAIITCVDNTALDESFVGRIYDESFLEALPDKVDPCGENGEFHSFVFDGPIFSRPIQYTKGEVVLKNNRFYFCDLLKQ